MHHQTLEMIILHHHKKSLVFYEVEDIGQTFNGNVLIRLVFTHLSQSERVEVLFTLGQQRFSFQLDMV